VGFPDAKRRKRGVKKLGKNGETWVYESPAGKRTQNWKTNVGLGSEKGNARPLKGHRTAWFVVGEGEHHQQRIMVGKKYREKKKKEGKIGECQF